MLALGVIGSSRKENEHRLPLHPGHFEFVPQSVRSAVRFETGYGTPFGVADEELRRRFAGVAERASLLADSDIVLLPKPQVEDLRKRDGGGERALLGRFVRLLSRCTGCAGAAGAGRRVWRSRRPQRPEPLRQRRDLSLFYSRAKRGVNAPPSGASGPRLAPRRDRGGAWTLSGSRTPRRPSCSGPS